MFFICTCNLVMWCWAQWWKYCRIISTIFCFLVDNFASGN